MGKDPSQEETSEPEVVYQVSLSKNLRLGPRQTQMAKVHIRSELWPQVLQVGRVSPSKELENQHCDLLEGLWEGAQEFEVPVTNWGLEPTMFSWKQFKW